MSSINFEFDGFYKPRTGRLELKKVTFLLGSERDGTHNVARLLSAMVLSKECGNPFAALEKTLGMPLNEVFPAEAYVKLGPVELKKSIASIEFVRGSLPWERILYAPALRSIAIATLLRLRQMPFYFDLVANAAMEALPSPVKLFLELFLNTKICERKFVITEDVLERIEESLGIPFQPNMTLGEVDEYLVKKAIVEVDEGTLVVVEEPSIFKSFDETVQEVKEYLEVAYKKDVYTFMSVSRAAAVIALNELVEEGKIDVNDVSAYYLEDGTIHKLETLERVGVDLSKLKLSVDVAE